MPGDSSWTASVNSGGHSPAPSTTSSERTTTMARTTTLQVVRSYLSQLDKALASVPGEVRDEIVAGIREELEGLDASAAATRIETLGDPEFIAAEARAEAEAGSYSPEAGLVEAKAAEPRWFSVLAALLVAVGGIVLPFIGWFVGIVLVWMSTSWRRADKWVATLLPLLAVVLASVTIRVVDWAGSLRAAPTKQAAPNPLIPQAFDLVWSSVSLFFVVNVFVGLWLLVRARKRWQSVPPVAAGTA